MKNEAVTYNYRAALGKFDASAATRGNLSFSLGSSGLSLDPEISSSSSRASKIDFSNGNFALMTDSDEESLLDRLRNTITWRPGSRYFLVRDAIQAKGINIEISSEDVAEFGGAAAIQNFVKASSNTKIEAKDRVIISSEFDQPVNVCVRAVEINITPPGAGVDSAPITEFPPNYIEYVTPESLFNILNADR